MPIMVRVFSRRPVILDEEGNFYMYDADTHTLDLIASDISDPIIGSVTSGEETTICRYKVSEKKLYGMFVSDWTDGNSPVFSERAVSCDKPYMANFDAIRIVDDEVVERRYLIGSATEDDTYSVWQST